MARVTIEDCIDKAHSRFDLIICAHERVRQIASGAPLTVAREHDKFPVVALREIAASTVGVDDLRENVVRRFQRYIETHDPAESMEEDTINEATYTPGISMADRKAEIDDSAVIAEEMESLTVADTTGLHEFDPDLDGK